MEHHHPSGFITAVISLIYAAVSIVMSDVQVIISISAGCVAIVAGFMSIRNSHYATMKTKKELKENE